MSSGASVKENVILLVEDNPVDELLALKALEQTTWALKIIVAHTGAEALKLLFESQATALSSLRQPPDFILLDLKLPQVSGINVLKKIRSDERTKTIPVVILSSSNEPKDITDSYRMGANSYHQKPSDYEAFSRLFRQLGGYWFGLNLLPVPPAFQGES